MKALKKAVALMLCVVMTLGIFAVSGITIDDLAGLFPKAKAYTNTTLDVITQEQVVSTGTALGAQDRDIFYEIYAESYFDGHSQPTDIVIPGLGSSSNYTPQGMTYWSEKNWILISAYDDKVVHSGRPSCIYAIDVASGKFVALFYIYNSDGTANTSHGGGIAASEYNFYYADSDSNISYIPLSEFDVAEGTTKNVTIKDTLSFSSEMNGANTSYCCYDDGVLWTGNFYYTGDADSYKTQANSAHNSMLLGYKLEGESSQEEWDYLCGEYGNLVTITAEANTNFTMDDYHLGNGNQESNNAGTYTAYKNGDTIDIVGNVTQQGTGAWHQFGTVTIEDKVTYRMEFTSTHRGTAYLITSDWSSVHSLTARGGTLEMTEDGLYHYSLEFTAGAPTNGTVISADDYTVRFDAFKGNGSTDLFEVGEAFTITDFKIVKAYPTNLINPTTTSLSNSNFDFTVTTNSDNSVNVCGTVTNTDSSEKESTYKFASVELVEGTEYRIEFISDNNKSDAYLFAPDGKHCNAKQAATTKITSLGNDLYHYSMTFTAGLKPTGADSSWPTTQSTDGTYTGTYTLRFDQDNVPANSSRTFNMTSFRVVKISDSVDGDRIHFPGAAGYPTYVVAFPNTYTTTIKNGNQDWNAEYNFDRIQYAMVDNGRIYVSRSWSRNMTSNNYISELDIIDISLDVPGTYSLTIGSTTRNDCYLVASEDIYQFHAPSMLEALCVIDDYLYMFTESAAYYYREYNGRDGNISTQPIDVVWKLDQYAVMGQDRKETVGGNNTRSSSGYVETYEKVNSLDELNYNDKYIIVYESESKAANGNNILYALDSYGGYKDGTVPKNSSGTQITTGDSMGIVGHPITKYAVDGDVLKLNDPASDDRDSLHWNLIGADTGSFRIENNDSYYSHYKNLYFGSRLMYMRDSEGNSTALDCIKIKDNGDGTFSFYYSGKTDYYLWCNDGTNQAYIDAYNTIYNNTYAFGGDNPDTTDEVESATGVKSYAGQVEQPGTFHSDAFMQHNINNSGNKTGEAVNEKYTKFHIYRRADDLSSSGKSGLSTDLSAELQADGTYTLTLESYATGQTITKKSTDGKPIDFVFVLDTSASMINNSDVSYMGMSDEPEPYSYDIANKENGRALKYGGNYFYFDRYKSGNYSNAAVKVGDTYYSIGQNSSFFEGGDASNKGIKNTSYGFAGGFYWVNRKGDSTRFDALKLSTLDFIQQIEDHAEKTGLQHRISIIQYGSTSDESYYNTGMYSTSNGVNMKNYSELIDSGFNKNNAVYEYAFYPANHDNLEEIVNNLSIDEDSDTFVGHGMTMALNTIADQMTLFNTSGDKVGDRIYGTYDKVGNEGGYTEADVNSKVCVINITDGAPGKGGSDEDSAYYAAKEAINQANTMKMYDVDIYTIQIGGNTVGSFQNSTFLDALSSNYISGSVTSTNDGDSSNSLNQGTSNGSGYYSELDISNALDLDSFFDNISQAGEGSILEIETVTLDSNSLTLQELGDTFMLTSDSTATVKIASTYYDSLGRIYEEDPVTTTAYTATTDVANNTVKVTGFDYSSKYIADNHTGEKLVLQIDGVLLNPDKQLGLNLPISNDAVTAIYANSSALSSGTATQYFPQAYFEVPTYSYTYDYGLSMTNSSIYGTPVSFDTLPDKQSTYATSVNVDGDSAIGYNGSIVTSNIAPGCDGIREAYTLLQKPDGSYYWAKIEMMPASNVYYEEGYFAVTASDNKDWSTNGSSAGLTQSMSASSDVYGYDAAYASGTGNSNGTAKYVTVDSTNKRSDTLNVNYTGTGFDLISACGTDTGIQTVVVKQGSTIKKVYIVDTFYDDTYGTLYQTPIVHFEGDYGTYTVETTATYLSKAGALTYGTVATNSVDGSEVEITSAPIDSVTAEEILTEIGMEELIGQDVELVWMDDDSIFSNGSGAEGANLSTQADSSSIALKNYVDGIRVYNPMEDQSAYVANEQDAQYYNVINNLAASDNGIFSSIKDIFAYIEGATFGEASFADYQKSGPQNELYLSNGSTGVTFSVNLPEGARVMLGVRAVSGSPKLTVNGNAIAINSATEMYYDVTDYLTASNGVAAVAITNTGSGLLAVNNMKLVGATTATLSTQSLDESIALMSLRPTDVEYTLADDNEVTVYPGSEPVREVENPDPDLDPAGEYVITYPSDDGSDSIIDNTASVIDTLISLLRSLLARIFNFIKTVFTAVSAFFKEV